MNGGMHTNKTFSSKYAPNYYESYKTNFYFMGSEKMNFYFKNKTIIVVKRGFIQMR